MGANVHRARHITVRKDPDGTISVWFQDASLIQRATPADAVAAIRDYFGTVDKRVLEYLGVE